MRFSSNRLGVVVLACVPALGLVTFALTNCSTSSTASMAGDAAVSGAAVVRSSATRAVPGDPTVAINANNAFALDLYAKTSPSANGGNFLLSPISADLALTMAYAGAKGTTASQMASVLHIPSGGTSIFDAQNALTQTLAGRGPTALMVAKEEGQPEPPSPSDYQLQVVNEVWGQTGYTWGTPFLTILAADYGTGVYTEDFSGDPSTAEAAINAWVDTETSGKINPLLPPMAITSDVRMVLVNAIHLKLPWESVFDPSATRSETFTRGDGSTEQTDFMGQAFEGSVGYAETGTAQLVSVPLADGAVSVVFALPKTDLSTLTSSLTPDMFSFQGSAYNEVVLNVPKFSFTSSPLSLAAPLQALGMTDAFSDAADFTGLCANPPDGAHLKLLDVLQRASIGVAEGGVEAAAATAILAGDGDDTGTPPSSITVTLDRPFVVAVVDTSGAILFLGQIDDPASSGG